NGPTANVLHFAFERLRTIGVLPLERRGGVSHSQLHVGIEYESIIDYRFYAEQKNFVARCSEGGLEGGETQHSDWYCCQHACCGGHLAMPIGFSLPVCIF